jgi:hypothetical protein
MPTMPIDGEKQPRFCPRCRRGRPCDLTLCPECGETLRGQGFCATCEQYWPHPEGAECPKHEVPLLAGRPELAVFRAGDQADWVTVTSFDHPIQAEAARIRVDAEGIPVLLQGQRVAGFHGGIGGIALQVPRALVQEARILLSQSWAPPFEGEEWEEDGDEPAAEPGLEPEHAASPLPWALALGVLLATLIFLEWLRR